MKRLRPVVPILGILLLALAFPVVAGAMPSYDRAVDQVIASKWPQRLEDYFTSLGTNPDLGFRWAGTSAERAVGIRVAREMRAMGLVRVHREAVPEDVFSFTKGALTVGDREMVASTFAGVPPTPTGGITAPIVYVGAGTAADYEGLDVEGKLVLVDARMASWWFNMPGFEAEHQGALGIIFTFTPDDPSYYSVAPDALGSFDGCWDPSSIPALYICQNDGDWLKQQIKSAETTATMDLRIGVRLREDGGKGYNVLGKIPGTSRDGQQIVFAAHQDVHFRAGCDDTGALVDMLVMARAMKMSGYRPAHDIVFLATTGEEFGNVDVYYDFCAGSLGAAKQHPGWMGRTRAFIVWETMAEKDAPLSVASCPELTGFFDRVDKTSLPYGGEVSSPISTWNDQWNFQSRGVLTAELAAVGADYWTLYHSNHETKALLDWNNMSGIAKYVYRATRGLDRSLLPYDFSAVAADLGTKVDGPALVDAGCRPARVDRLVDAVAAFAEAAGDVESDRAALAARSVVANRVFLAAAKTFNANLSALDMLDHAIYPHQQVLGDVQGLDAAIAALTEGTPDPDAALDALGATYMTWYGINFSYPVYIHEISRRDPGYARIGWGGTGRLPIPLDVMPEWRMILKGDYAAAAEGLSAKREVQVTDLNKRITAMATALETAADQLGSLTDR
jgi:aminopeptidase YwaD